MSRDRPGWLQSWQHSTIARRVDFLQRVLADPRVEPRFQRRVGIVKWALFLVLGIWLLVLVTTWGWKSLFLGPEEESRSSRGTVVMNCEEHSG
jgi:hypothetical protein